MTNHCNSGNEKDSTHPEIGQTVSLPVLDSKHSGSRAGAPMMGRTKIARWRAAVLITVNLLMIAHLIQWLIVGMTISPIEPSETMETLEVGVVNAGAIFFLVAIISTILLGRFFCGWLCHVVALQDLCAWMMTSIGIRPKPFRSRLLVYFPFFLGMYMFVWPSFKRLALLPILKSASIDWPAWLKPVEPVHQWSTGLVVDDFWATMPPWFIAVPFLFICGFAAVYFLGAKGFCTYGCPYAAFFKPLDKVAPVRIRVNDDCHQCGYCTSVCTSNVRVSEEVRDFGMVVDAGCMKTLDCISACPNDALSLGFGKPALGAKPRSVETYKDAQAKKARRFDMTLGEEIFASLLFIWFFFATRGMLDAVPMLMAGGLAAIGVMIVMQCMKMFREDNARIYGMQLKARGKIKAAGFVVLFSGLFFVVGSYWAGHAHAMRWRGDVLFASSDVPTSVLLRDEFQPSLEFRKQAQTAINVYHEADSFKDGGKGWKLSPEHRLRLSYFHSVLGDFELSLDELLRVIQEGHPTTSLVLQAGQLSSKVIEINAEESETQGDLQIRSRARLLEIYQVALDTHPELHKIRTELSRAAYSTQEVDKANAYWEINEFDDDYAFWLAKSEYVGFYGDMQQTSELILKAFKLLKEQEQPAGMMATIAQGAMRWRMRDLALDLAQQAIDDPSATAQTWLAAGEVANALGEEALGLERAQHALTLPGIDRPIVQARAAGVIARPGNLQQARELLIDAANRSSEPFEVLYIAQGMIFAGSGLNDPEMLQAGMETAARVSEENPDLYIIGHDYGSMLYSVGRTEEAIAQITKVAIADSTNPVLASRVAELMRMTDQPEEEAKWLKESLRRTEALQK